jgi:branched-subunit amino acid transport protein AzlD
VLVAASLPLLSLGLGLSFLDPDEGLYADVAARMLASGDWIVPRFNGLPYLEKPPLYFWLSALALGVGMPGEWALRGVPALAAFASVLLCWRIGRRLYGSGAGLRAGLALATMAGYALYVRKASTDLLFVACLSLVVYGLVRDAERPDRGPTRFLLVYLGAALAVLTKGLIGLLFPLSIVAASLLRVRRLGVGDLNLVRGTLLFALVALPWHALVGWRAPDLFSFYVVDNQILRFLDLRGFLEDDVPIATLGFLAVTFLWLFPWGVFVLVRPRPAPSPLARWRPVVAMWVLVVVGFFSVSRSKLEYYALPALPAFAVLAGRAWDRGRDLRGWLWGGLGLHLAGGAALVWLGAGLTPGRALDVLAALNVYYRILRDQGLGFPFPSARPFGAVMLALGMTAIVGWGLAAGLWTRGRPRGAFAALVGVGLVTGGLIVVLLHLVEPHHSARAVSLAIVERARADDVIAHEGALEYSAALPFYTRRRVVVVNGARGDLEPASRFPEARGWFVDAPGLRRLWDGAGRVFLVTQRARERSVVGALPTGSVTVLGRFGSRWLYSNRPDA